MTEVPDVYVVTVDGPDDTRVRRVLPGRLVRSIPGQAHAGAAYLASVAIQAAFDLGGGKAGWVSLSVFPE